MINFIRYSYSAIFALACLTLITGCSDKEKIEALERMIEDQKKAIEQEKTEVVRTKAELELSTAQAKEKEKELAATSENLRNLDKELSQLKAKISEKQEEELATKNKYSHEALGENPSKDQLDAFFIAFETIEKDSPKILEDIITHALKEEDIDYRQVEKFGAIAYLKGKFTPYTGWMLSKTKKTNNSDLDYSYPKIFLKWCYEGRFNMGISIGFSESFSRRSLVLFWDDKAIKSKSWYSDGKLCYEKYYEDGKLYSASSWRYDNNVKNYISCSETNLKEGNGSYVFYDLMSYVSEKGKINKVEPVFEEMHYKGKIHSRREFDNGFMRVMCIYMNNKKYSERIYDTSIRTLKGSRGYEIDKESDKAIKLETFWDYNGKVEKKVFYNDGIIVKTEKF